MNNPLRSSKLEIYVDVLNVLKDNPLKLTHKTLKAKVNFLTLRDSLLQLIQHNLIEEQVTEKRKHENVFYALTKKGKKFLKTYQQMVLMFDRNSDPAITKLFLG